MIGNEKKKFTLSKVWFKILKHSVDLPLSGPQKSTPVKKTIKNETKLKKCLFKIKRSSLNVYDAEPT